MTVASTIAIKLDAQTAELKKGFAESRRAVDRLGAGLSGKVASGMAKFHVALMGVQGALAAVRGGINAVLGAMTDIDATEKFAARVGMASDQLRVLNFAAEQTGASTRTMQTGLQRMTRRVSEAANGTGEAVKAIKELGLSAAQLEQLSPDQQFAAIADAMQQVDGQSDKVRLAMKLFDSEGVALVNTLAAGSEGLNKFGAEAESLGMLLGDQGAAVEAANDSINRMKKAWGGFVQQIAIAIAPAIEALAKGLTEVLKTINKLTEPLRWVVEKVSEALGGMFRDADPGGQLERKFTSSVEALTAKVQTEAPKVEKALTAAVQTPLEKARKIVGDVREQFDRAEASFARQGVGAVTRSTAAGFSAEQAARRQAEQRRREHQAELAELQAIRRALTESGLAMVEVDI